MAVCPGEATTTARVGLLRIFLSAFFSLARRCDCGLVGPFRILSRSFGEPIFLQRCETEFGMESLGLRLGSFCHGNFGPAEKLVRGTKISGISVRGGPFFPENFGPPVKITVRPASEVNSACCCLVRLIELDYYTMADSCN